MKKYLKILAVALLAAFAASCVKTNDDVLYSIKVEPTADQFAGSPSSDAKKTYNDIKSKLNDFEKSYNQTWTEKVSDKDFSAADRNAKAAYDKALAAFQDLESSAKTAVAALPTDGVHDSFLISRTIKLSRFDGESSGSTIAEYTMTLTFNR